MEVKRFSTQLLGANCYVVVNHNSAVVIDPAGVTDEVTAYLRAIQANLYAIINTHGHIDHIMSNAWLKAETNAPIWIHQGDSQYLIEPELNLSNLVLGEKYIGPAADRFLQDQEKIELGDASLTVIHTPGHSPGSICLLGSGFLFSGDTLFELSVGRSDFPGGNAKVLKESLRKLARTVPETTVIYPGHGRETTMERELVHNPFLR